MTNELSLITSRVKEELWEKEMLGVGGASAQGCRPDAGSFAGKTTRTEDESECGGGRGHTSVCSKPPYENECTTFLPGPHLDQRQPCVWGLGAVRVRRDSGGVRVCLGGGCSG